MSDAEIGLIGLGTMGSNLALNIAEKGHKIAVWNRTASRTKSFVDGAGPLAENLIACSTPEELLAAVRPPRPNDASTWRAPSRRLVAAMKIEVK